MGRKFTLDPSYSGRTKMSRISQYGPYVMRILYSVEENNQRFRKRKQRRRCLQQVHPLLFQDDTDAFMVGCSTDAIKLCGFDQVISPLVLGTPAQEFREFLYQILLEIDFDNILWPHTENGTTRMAAVQAGLLGIFLSGRALFLGTHVLFLEVNPRAAFIVATNRAGSSARAAPHPTIEPERSHRALLRKLLPVFTDVPLPGHEPRPVFLKQAAVISEYGGTDMKEPKEHGVILEVPYQEKELAKKLGAWWDPERKKWFVPRGVDPKPFQRWVTREGSDSSPTSYRNR